MQIILFSSFGDSKHRKKKPLFLLIFVDEIFISKVELVKYFEKENNQQKN